jgi:DNA modification methylase
MLKYGWRRRGWIGREKKNINMRNIIYNENCISGLKKLPEKSVNTCITSPPYYGLRDYGNDEQIGLEETPAAFIQKLVDVFREVKRVLQDDGTLWVNIGDSYSSHKDCKSIGQTLAKGTSREDAHVMELGKSRVRDSKMLKSQGLKNKDLIGIPWMLAFALRADGWYLRQDIIWHKPNPMPESVTDRCTKAHEYIFLLSKSPKYYYDYEAIKEEAVGCSGVSPTKTLNNPDRAGDSGLKNGWEGSSDRNKRSVWTVTTKPFSEAHFATFPEDLIVDCVKAGCPRDGVILDPFMGAGTTALVARSHNRNYIGFELNPEYIAIAEKRLNKELGIFR